jgi:tetratricopeptide (TPR) repeat protein
VPQGAAARVEFPGEDPLSAEQLQLQGGLDRILGIGCGRVVVGGADVPETLIDFEVMQTERDYSALYALTALSVVAMLALAAGSLYHVVRQWGDGHVPRWGEPMQIGADQAKFLRVTMDPSAQGATKLAAGEGVARHGVDSPLLVPTTRPKKKDPATDDTHTVAVATHKKPRAHHPETPEVTDDVDADHVVAVHGPTPPTDVDEDDADDDDDDSGDDAADTASDDTKDHDTLVQNGQQALLAAELRSAIDSLTAAEHTDKLDYDNLNWLGLAHYFLGENEQAEARWKEALAMDPTRPDAVNNLGGIFKRRGETGDEIGEYQKALELRPGDCHALNSMALALAKQSKFAEAQKTLADSDVACGGNYAYTFIQRAGILSLSGKTADAMTELEKGLGKVDTLIPIKEYEVEADLLLDPAFAPLRKQAGFDALTAKFLPRASQSKAAILSSLNQPKKASAPVPPPQDVEL